jgi:hypothetical protein
MLKTVLCSTATLLLVTSGTAPAAWAKNPSSVAAKITTPVRPTIATSARNWREWFRCDSKGACGGNPNTPVSREPVNILRNPAVQANESKPVNSLLFTIEGMPGTWPGLKIATP